MFNLSKPHKLDPIFGSMVFVAAKLRDYWESTVHFEPDNRDIDVFVDGAKDEDFSEQRTLYSHILANWSSLLPNIEAGIQQHFPEDPGDLNLSALSIPKAASFDDASWEAFVTPESSQYSYTVELTGDRVMRVSRDC